MVSVRPFGERDLDDDFGFYPPASLHFVRGQALSPACGFRLRKVEKRADLGAVLGDSRHHSAAGGRHKPALHAGDIAQSFALALADDEFIERAAVRPTATDEEGRGEINTGVWQLNPAAGLLTSQMMPFATGSLACTKQSIRRPKVEMSPRGSLLVRCWWP